MHDMGAFWTKILAREGSMEIFGTRFVEGVSWVERRPERHCVRFGGPNFFRKIYLIKIEICIKW